MRGEKRGREFGSEPEVSEGEGHEQQRETRSADPRKAGARSTVSGSHLKTGKCGTDCPEDAAPTNVIVGVVAHDGRAGELDPDHQGQTEQKSRRAFECGISAGAIGEARSRMRLSFGVA